MAVARVSPVEELMLVDGYQPQLRRDGLEEAEFEGAVLPLSPTDADIVSMKAYKELLRRCVAKLQKAEATQRADERLALSAFAAQHGETPHLKQRLAEICW